MQAGWPRRRNSLARGILALSLKCGARDFADDKKVTRERLGHREYHHLFPQHLLVTDGRMSAGSAGEADRAMNCALVTWKTNRQIAAKEPMLYLRERTEAARLGEEDVRRRLDSHLVPFEELAVGGYGEILDEVARAERVKSDYSRFLKKRAEVMRSAIEALFRGEVWP